MSTDPAEVYMTTIPSSVELRGLLARATERPWTAIIDSEPDEDGRLIPADVVAEQPPGYAVDVATEIDRHPDAALIVALVNSAEHLLGALEENERLREALEEARAGLLPIARRAISDPPAVAAEQLCRIDSALARPHPDDATSSPITREMLEATRDRPIQPDPSIVLPPSRHPDEEGDSDAG